MDTATHTINKQRHSDTETKTQRVRHYLDDCAGITWDGCHKIYILMDTEQVEKSKSYGYDIVTAPTAKDYMKLLKEFYHNSCALRFVDVIFTGDNEDIYIAPVSQGESWR